MSQNSLDKTSGWISDIIDDCVAKSPLNSLAPLVEDRAWEQPLVGIAAGDDPIFQTIKNHVGEFFWTPAQAFALAHPNEDVKPAELSVIAWVLPQRAATKAENAVEKVYPSRRWVAGRGPGEDFNLKLRSHVVDELAQAGHPATAPQLMPQWQRRDSEAYGYASTWSERHAAHAAGLGTFGLCDGLITPKGKAVRVGSVVARLKAEPTPRPYTDHHAYCLWFSHGTCGLCIERCPVKALSPLGHHKVRCYNHTHGAAFKRNQKTFGLDIPACGLCQVGVPCTDGIPKPSDLERPQFKK